MKKTLFFGVILFALLVFGSAGLHAQDAVEGSYTVGKTGCTIEWDSYNKSFQVYWDGGTGYTILFYIKDAPNGNVIYDEYEKDGTTYTGTFTFKSDSYKTGTYSRADGKEFSIKRRR
jgi:hypothetical protein